MSFGITRPAFVVGITTSGHIHEIEGTGARAVRFLPEFIERVPAPRASVVLLQKLRGISNGDATEFTAFRRRRGFLVGAGACDLRHFAGPGFLQPRSHWSYRGAASTLTEIESAIAKLPAPEFRELLHKLNKRDAAEWERQIEEDAQSGKLDRLYSRMMEKEGGKVALDEVLDDPKLS